ncbi:uncharacterized protein LOC114184388 [Vigna unguiculata]|uniref:uncharacterized protein LOC114184386 n=1 Tax=Vigna unguiculata TaxID=3917 RepID=UPI001016E4D1|nr:uncharacterized protein LOC114184386 [Vigna unguiculata]XP_027927500.1 uncharacterized protein LOC114184388 [Vigna unguiculata]
MVSEQGCIERTWEIWKPIFAEKESLKKNLKVGGVDKKVAEHMAGMRSIIQGGLPVFDGKLFDEWKIKMLAVFGFQEVAEIIQEGIVELGSKATEDEKKYFKQQQKLDSKARFLLYQCVSSKIFNKICKATTAKEIWEILLKTYGDGDKHKKVKLQALRRRFEFLVMEENESVADKQIAHKILRSLPSKFDHLVITIEEAKDLETLELEELQHLLEVHEFRRSERKLTHDQAYRPELITEGSSKGKRKTESNGRGTRIKKVNLRNLGKRIVIKQESPLGIKRGRWSEKQPKNQANLAQDEGSDSKAVMLMAQTCLDLKEEASWYLDSGCSSHMIGRKDWFVKMEEATHGKIRFADNSSLTAQGTGRVVLRDEDGKEVVLEDLLFVPGLKTNLLSLDQLPQKGFVMTKKDNCLNVFDQSNRLIIQSNLSKNRTFRVGMNALKHHCFAASESKT